MKFENARKTHSLSELSFSDLLIPRNVIPRFLCFESYWKFTASRLLMWLAGPYVTSGDWYVREDVSLLDLAAEFDKRGGHLGVDLIADGALGHEINAFGGG